MSDQRPLGDCEIDTFSCIWDKPEREGWKEFTRAERVARLVDTSFSVSTLLGSLPPKFGRIRIVCPVGELRAMCRWLALIEDDGHALPDELRIEVGYQEVTVSASRVGFAAQASLDPEAYRRYWPAFESAAAGVLEALKCRAGEVRPVHAAWPQEEQT